MSIYDYTVRPEAAREEAVKLFISAIQSFPEIVQKELSEEKFADFLINGANKLKEYVLPSDIYYVDERRKLNTGKT